MDLNLLNLFIDTFLLEQNLNTLNRTFGVEFEMCFRKGSLMKYIQEHPRLFSGENGYGSVDFVNGNFTIWEDVLKAEGFGDWEIHDDSSVKSDFDSSGVRADPSMEIVTPILYGEDGLNKILSFLEFAVNKLGGYTNETCGGHIHIGAKDLIQGSQKQVANKLIVGLLTAKNFAPLLRALVPKGRRDSKFAKPITLPADSDSKIHSQLSSLEDEETSENHIYELIHLFSSDRYKMINFQSLTSIGTIEFRIFDGSLDYKTIEERVRFGTAFVNLLAQTEIDLTKNLKSLKDQLTPHLEKGPRTTDVKELLRKLYYSNLREQKALLIKINNGISWVNTKNLTNQVGIDLLAAVSQYPLFKKPVNLLEHEIAINFRTAKNVADAIKILQEGDIMMNTPEHGNKVIGTTIYLSPVTYHKGYKNDLQYLLNNSSQNQYFIDKGITPEQFLEMIEPAEAEPYKISLEKYKKDPENNVAAPTDNFNGATVDF